MYTEFGCILNLSYTKFGCRVALSHIHAIYLIRGRGGAVVGKLEWRNQTAVIVTKDLGKMYSVLLKRRREELFDKLIEKKEDLGQQNEFSIIYTCSGSS